MTEYVARYKSSVIVGSSLPRNFVKFYTFNTDVEMFDEAKDQLNSYNIDNVNEVWTVEIFKLEKIF
jgi:hypothetical protein